MSGEDVPVEQRIRAQLRTLEGIEDLPLAEHAERYDQVHAALQAALGEIDGEHTIEGEHDGAAAPG